MSDENKLKKLAPKLVTPRTTVDPDMARVRISVRQNGKGLVGMIGWGENAATGITASEGLKKALGVAKESNGCVKISIEGDQLVGSKVRTKPGEPWGEHLTSLQAFLKVDAPVYFTLFRSTQQCLLVTYVPESAKPMTKMLYAATKNAVKSALTELDDSCHVEEFNISVPSELSYTEYSRRENVPKFYTEQEKLSMEHQQAETAGGYSLLARINPTDKNLDKEKLAKLEKLRKKGSLGGPVPEQQFQSGGEEFAKPIALPGLANLKKAVPRVIKTRLEDVEHHGNEDSEELAKNFKQKAATTSLKENEEKEIKQKFHLPEQQEEKIEKKETTEGEKDAIEDETEEVEPETEKEQNVEDKNMNETLKDMSEDLDNIEQNYHADVDTDNEQAEEAVTKNVEQAKTKSEQTTVSENKRKEEEEEEEEKEGKADVPDDKTELTDLKEEEEEKKEKKIEMEETAKEQEEEEEGEKETLGAVMESAETVLKKTESKAEKPSLKKQQTDKSKLFVSSNGSIVSKVTRSLSFKMPSFTRKTNANSAKEIVKTIAEKTTRLLRKGKNTNTNVVLDQQFLSTLDAEDGVRTYEELQEMRSKNDFEGCDKNQLETYLSSRDFALVFGMTREQFIKLGSWKQKKLKKKVNLY